ncbi:MAG: peptidoglycan DD-metalloendopeptidase family protein [Candidatus Margulisiibacteriota bacterium]|jgi:murein DD-endopeptidase MepM/ murein hydrolase activator NlpD
MINGKIIILILLLACSAVTFAEEEIEATKIKLAEVQNELNIKKNKLYYIRKEEARVLDKLGKIKQDLRYAKNNLRHANDRKQIHETHLKKLEKDLNVEEENLGKELALFRQRILDINKSQNLGYLELFFSSASLSDFINQAYFFDRVIMKDVDIIRKLRTRKDRISQTKEYIADKVQEIGKLAQEIEQQKQKIQSDAEQENKVYDTIYQQRLVFEKEVEELERNSQEIETLLQRIIAQKRGVKLKGSGRFAWPLEPKDYYISSSYGYRRHPIFRIIRFHSGLDMASRRGVPIKSADSGEVIFEGWWGGYGRAVIVDHGNNFSTVYAHMSSIQVKKGQVVNRGDVIGLVGSTGYSTGPHLHFEIRKDGKTANPLTYLPKR